MIKKIITLLATTAMSSTLLFGCAAQKPFGTTSTEASLQDNQAYLFYMYTNEEGHYFLDPSTNIENVIYVGLDDFYLPAEPHHGTKFVGTFVDDTLWELEKLEVMS